MGSDQRSTSPTMNRVLFGRQPAPVLDVTGDLNVLRSGRYEYTARSVFHAEWVVLGNGTWRPHQADVLTASYGDPEACFPVDDFAMDAARGVYGGSAGTTSRRCIQPECVGTAAESEAAAKQSDNQERLRKEIPVQAASAVRTGHSKLRKWLEMEFHPVRTARGAQERERVVPQDSHDTYPGFSRDNYKKNDTKVNRPGMLLLLSIRGLGCLVGQPLPVGGGKGIVADEASLEAGNDGEATG